MVSIENNSTGRLGLDSGNHNRSKLPPPGGKKITGIKADDEVIKPFAKAKNMQYNVGTDKGGKLSKELGITGIPHAILVHKAGEVVWEGHPHPSGLKDEEIGKFWK